MNPVRWKYLSAVFLVLSLIFLASVEILPLQKSPQHVVYQGPAYSSPEGGATISGYYIPTVDTGSRVTVSIYDFVPGLVDITIFPTQSGAISPSGSPLYVKTPQINTTEYFISDSTQPYGIYIYSRNNSRFTLIVDATYSPYYWLSTYASVAVFLTFASAILLYYYNFTARRWRYEQAEIRRARGEASGPSKAGR
jgi:hypothetical protein